VKNYKKQIKNIIFSYLRITYDFSTDEKYFSFGLKTEASFGKKLVWQTGGATSTR
jgi:hypothetical protein